MKDLVVAPLDVRLLLIGDITSIGNWDRGPQDDYLGLSPWVEEQAIASSLRNLLERSDSLNALGLSAVS